MTWQPGLALYALRGGRGGPALPVRPPRPEGRAIWLHVPPGATARPMLALARRLTDEDGLGVVMTASDPPDPRRGVVVEPAPDDRPATVRDFLDHWQPVAGVIADGELRPILMTEAAARGIPLALVDARAPYLPAGRPGWYPGLRRHLLARVAAVLAVDETAARAFRRAGAPDDAVRAAGRLEQPSAALPNLEAERAAMSRLLAARPVWLAAHLPEEEEALVIEAHRAVLRLAHRLLLIVVPEDAGRAAPLAERMEQVEGWTVARRSADEDPDAEVQVCLADGPAEMGLWYRLAPVTYLGGSLTAGGARADPLAAAALGSAILHGPRSGPHGATIGRLAAAQATALVGSSAELAETLGELLAPDRAARLAQAAWIVTTEGAEVTERALALIRRMIGGAG